MYDAVLVGVTEGGSDLVSEAHHFLHREFPLAIQPLAQRLPLDVGHHVVEETVGFAGVVERQDVGMREVCCDLDLTHEALDAEARGEFRAKNLDCYLAPMLEVLGEIDGCHPARTEFPFDGVAVGE